MSHGWQISFGRADSNLRRRIHEANEPAAEETIPEWSGPGETSGMPTLNLPRERRQSQSVGDIQMRQTLGNRPLFRRRPPIELSIVKRSRQLLGIFLDIFDLVVAIAQLFHEIWLRRCSGRRHDHTRSCV